MKRKSYSVLLSLLLAIFLAGCYPPAESIAVEETCELAVGSTAAILWTVVPEDAQDKDLTFVSSDTTIATVDETGSITGISPGGATIKATLANGISAEVTVNVTLPVERVSAETTLTLDAGLSGCVNAQIYPRNATYPILNYVSGDDRIATVDETGLVTAISAGNTSITITAHNGQQATTAVAVEIPVTEVTLDQTTMTVYPGDTAALTASIMPEDATRQDLTWESSAPEVAIVDETGTITAFKQGEATITATTDNGKKASCIVTVSRRNTGSGSGNIGRTASTGAGGSNGTGNASGGNPANSAPAGGNAGGVPTVEPPPAQGGGEASPAPPPAPALLSDAQIQQAIGEATAYAAGLGFTIVGDRQPGHGIASVAYYDYGAFVQNLRENVDYVASICAGDDLSLAKVCFVREGNSVYVTYG